MSAVVAGLDEQDELDIDVDRWVSLVEHALDSEGIRGAPELSLLFVDEDRIAGLNAEFMGHEGPTDVLAFPIDDDPAERARQTLLELPVLLGDVVICPAVAARQAPGQGSTVDDELALLVVHGVLHLLGHDHGDATEQKLMQARERAVLESFDP